MKSKDRNYVTFNMEHRQALDRCKTPLAVAVLSNEFVRLHQTQLQGGKTASHTYHLTHPYTSRSRSSPTIPLQASPGRLESRIPPRMAPTTKQLIKTQPKGQERKI